jgi:Domain of unknown function (DUF5610)
MVTSNINSQNTPGQIKPSSEQYVPAQSKQLTPELTPAQKQKASLNASIVESAQVSIGAKDESLALLLKTAIDKINEALAPELGEDAIQQAVDSGLDVSPEATAERIVGLSTAFYGAFKEQNPNNDELSSLDNFLKTIGGGIDKGFEQARDILESLKVLEGDVASNINETYDLVQDKLAAFKTMILELGAEPDKS